MSTSKQNDKTSEYEWLREFKKVHGRELTARYGAHAIGIGKKRVAGQKSDQQALLFYVESKRAADWSAKEPIPPTISFLPSGSDETVLLHTDVVIMPPATSELE